MSIFKRGNTWWAYITVPGRKPLQRSLSTHNREQAQELHDKIKHELWRVRHLGEKPRRSWKEAVVRFLDEKRHKRSLKSDLAHIRWLDAHLGGLMLDEITIDVVAAIRDEKCKTAKPSSCNRMLAFLRSVLKMAKDDWEWLERIPAVRLLKEPKRRIRWLTAVEVERLLAELPPHLRDMAGFSLATGLREGNVVNLEWEQVDMPRRSAWIHADQFKTDKAIAVPLNQKACAIIRAQIGKNSRYVFTFEGKKVDRANTKAWRNALKRAGIEDFRWHDLRHTWASWHVQDGTPLNVLQELGGWESAEMVRRYAHLGGEHLREYIETRRIQMDKTNATDPKLVATARRIADHLFALGGPDLRHLSDAELVRTITEGANKFADVFKKTGFTSQEAAQAFQKLANAGRDKN